MPRPRICTKVHGAVITEYAVWSACVFGRFRICTVDKIQEKRTLRYTFHPSNQIDIAYAARVPVTNQLLTDQWACERSDLLSMRIMYRLYTCRLCVVNAIIIIHNPRVDLQ